MQFPSPPWILIDSLHKQIIRKLFKSNTVYNYHHNLLSYCHRTLTILSSLSVQFSYSVVSNSLQLHGHQALWRQASLSNTNSQSFLKLMSIKSVMPSNYLILCHPLLLPPSVLPSISVFSNESVLPSSGQSSGTSASSSVLPMNIQEWFPLVWTGGSPPRDPQESPPTP